MSVSSWSSADMSSYRRPSSSSSSSTASCSASSSSSFATTMCSAPPSQASVSSSSSSPSSARQHRRESVDRFYGYRHISELSEAVISGLFACPLDSSSSSASSDTPQCTASGRPTPRLSEFIAYALHRTRLPEEVTYQSLFLLRRLKSRFPAARGSSGHRLFISALMLASKSSCDDTYSNKSWTIVSQGLFTLREVNQMERELFGYLGYKVNVEPEELEAFTILLEEGQIAAVTDMNGSLMSAETQHDTATTDADTVANDDDMQDYDRQESQSPSIDTIQSEVAARLAMHHEQRRASVPITGTVSVAAPALPSVSTFPAQSCAMQASYTSQGPYHAHAHPAATAAAAAAAAAMAARHNGHMATSPSMASITSSSRGSFSSASVYSATPSPSLASRAGDSSNSSSHESPDTPPSEFDGSPWADEGKPHFTGGEPAGTYEQQYGFYEHFKQQQQQMMPCQVTPQHCFTATTYPAAYAQHFGAQV